MRSSNKKSESKNVPCCFNKADNKKGSEIVMMKTVILAEKPSQAKAYADSFSKATRKDGYFEIQDRLFTGETVITYGFGHLVELD
ncbi:DNA topoisomerase III, partial [Enterococcus faecium]|nr:DNA topoisomerase III [Enterococcus faecium]